MELFNTDSEIFAWVVLPFLIFLSRIADQTIGTVRLIFLSKGFKFYAPLLGFFEVIIWLLAVTQIIKHVDNVISYVAYGAGFAAGNYIGMIVEEKLSIGKVIIRIIPKYDTKVLLNYMKEQGFGVTKIDAEGSMGKVNVIFSVLNRKDLKQLIPAINEFNPHAFYSIEDVRTVKEGVFRTQKKRMISTVHTDTKKIK
ncbi:MAG: DUF2179 domain-containing protein [Bacteroidales bacterium]|nr:DUF2179 domain-containing protein [Bacteroidales bacterium]MCF8345387.1 DUF2179 domain-containing protein [Bacteroidales bacterium]MCF8352493.1 DUF2179 domain-containing protein [Bacteroidales bacterium]MCF8375428.1 DUF2179 domain-containing protein [Bacteroidales bacterium]MCF8400976.1 DUF2179 domain-containing protein [Bacteroidales bacterium]